MIRDLRDGTRFQLRSALDDGGRIWDDEELDFYFEMAKDVRDTGSREDVLAIAKRYAFKALELSRIPSTPIRRKT